MKLRLECTSAPARTVTTSAPSTMTTKRCDLEGVLNGILAAPAVCDLTRDILNRMRRARDQLLTFAALPRMGRDA